MGLLVSVYRTRGMDCTRNGISHRADTLCLVNVSGPFEPDAQAPAAWLMPGNAPGTVKIVPASHDGKAYCMPAGWWMMGGNYAATSDSRFTEAVERILGHVFYGAVAIHDREE
jgi:hypothetical protein